MRTSRNAPVKRMDPEGLFDFVSYLIGLIPGSATYQLYNQAVDTAKTGVAAGNARRSLTDRLCDPNGDWGNSEVLNGGRIGGDLIPSLQKTAKLTVTAEQYSTGAGFNATRNSPDAFDKLNCTETWLRARCLNQRTLLMLVQQPAVGRSTHRWSSPIRRSGQRRSTWQSWPGW